MILLNIIVLVVVALGAWWLTGIDKNVSGESKRDRYFFRAVRCVIVLFLVAVLLWVAEQPASPGGVLMLLIVPTSIALMLRSSIAEFFTHGFLRFLDPSLHDDRELDLNQTQRYRDTIAHLIHNGRKDEAIKLCEELKESGAVDIVTLETTLEFLGVKQERAALERPLNRADRLRTAGKFSEAAALLKSLLVKNPADTGAALLLMRLYAGDLRQPGRAAEVLRALEKQPHVERAQIEFARRSLDEWSRMKPGKIQAAPLPLPESVDELLAQRHFGSAIERLEENIRTPPGDFELRLKLAEIFARHCDDWSGAGKVIRQLEAEKVFSAEQLAVAAGKLKEWREARGPRK